MSRKVWERCTNDVLLFILSNGVNIGPLLGTEYCTVHSEESLSDDTRYDKITNIYTLINKYTDEFVKLYENSIEKLVEYEYEADGEIDLKFKALYPEHEHEDDYDIKYNDSEKILSDFNGIIPIVIQLEENFFIVATIIEHYITKAYCYPLLEQYFDQNLIWVILDI